MQTRPDREESRFSKNRLDIEQGAFWMEALCFIHKLRKIYFIEE